MRSEQPLASLHRRLRPHNTDDESAAAEDDDDEIPVPSWIPDGNTDRGRSWLTAIRADPGRSGGIALAVIAVVAVLITVFALMRDDPPPIVSAKLPPVEMVSSAAPRPGPDTNKPVVVSVVGLVTKPGLVTLAPEARIADAVSAAGGALNGADTLGLNLARHLTDGEQIVVGIGTPAGQPTALGSSVSGGPPAGSTPPVTPGKGPPAEPVNLNTATVEQLDALPGIGPVMAASIIAWRDANGKFTSIDQLGDVDGIGPARLDKLRALVRV
ncbi:ComEA family DNA-binding protein [Mycolicibacterium sp. P1-5]|uniref:ComEA family DNA-binding protein n=1 Tax=Mycolicibacterium sp. P1-5 TaxID=2024617 RepID=UPI0011EF9C4B|nr:ComEA family DNA-binding protein [Mycolicibacterium sp. P1-5]KAA0100337.1 ComEA family DNA-binding protein [Mycolicibacterium sp. P1-5]